jgi:hypothetical protein
MSAWDGARNYLQHGGRRLHVSSGGEYLFAQLPVEGAAQDFPVYGGDHVLADVDVLVMTSGQV